MKIANNLPKKLEIQEQLGYLSNLKTVIKDSLVSSINWLYDTIMNKLGETDISSIGDGTITGAIKSLDSNKADNSLIGNDKLSTNASTLTGAVNEINNNLTWTRVDISLQSSNTAWSEVIVSAPEILTAKEFCLFDSANGYLTPIFPALTGGYIQYSNGMGASDPYCISGQFRVYSDGRIGYSPSRIGTAAKAPKFTYLYYR